MNDLLRNLAAGARLALFLPLRADQFRATPVQFAVLSIFNFVLWVGSEWVRAGFEGDFDTSAASVYLATVALVLASALVVAAAYKAYNRLLLLAVAFCAADPLFDLADDRYLRLGQRAVDLDRLEDLLRAHERRQDRLFV